MADKKNNKDSTIFLVYMEMCTYLDYCDLQSFGRMNFPLLPNSSVKLASIA